MGSEFNAVFLYILIGILVALGMLTASAILSPGRGKTNPVKQMPYESGMDPVGDTRQRFDVRFHLVAIAFLLFDVELLFLYPWAVAQWSHGSSPVPRAVVEASPDPAAVAAALQVHQAAGIPPELRNVAFLGALLFLIIVVAGFAYDWRKGVFEWR
jgi:NADH-quinone oxidoreductase subunit A